MKKITKELIIKKMLEKWFKDNPDLVNDIGKLANELTLFNVKWGQKLSIDDFLSLFS